MALDELKETEQALEVNEIQILMDDQVKMFAAGQVIDYVKAYGREGFTISQEGGGSGC